MESTILFREDWRDWGSNGGLKKSKGNRWGDLNPSLETTGGQRRKRIIYK